MNETISIPVKAHMVKRDGEWVVDENHPDTVYADIPVDDVTRFLMKGFGLTPT